MARTSWRHSSHFSIRPISSRCWRGNDATYPFDRGCIGFPAAVSYARAADDSTKNHIIALERGALERWWKGDPQGFFDIMSNEETYFDPMVGKRIDGKEALRKFFAPFTGKIRIERFEMIDSRVQR